jgi:hypothetical protein
MRAFWVILLAALALPATATAGGWATVALSSTPAGSAPGKPWSVELTVLQHGRTPLDGVQPTITIAQGTGTRTFTAAPAGRPGVYRATVVFPTAGRWQYRIDDGFGRTHSYPPVRIGGEAVAAGGGGGGGLPWVPILAALGAGLLAVVLVLAVRAPRRVGGKPA